MIFFRLVFFSVLIFYISNDILGQDTIYLNNPSFEDIPGAGTPYKPPIIGWQDCGLIKFPNETPPDIQPMAWGVETKAFDGKTYLSMVVRDNDTWESVSQKLEIELQTSKCYTLQVYLSRSNTYKSRTKKSPDQLQDFTTPVVLQIWGGQFFCDKQSLLALSEPVENKEWQLYTLFFRADHNFKYITLEAFYLTPTEKCYNGHLLLDSLSPIIETDCFK